MAEKQKTAADYTDPMSQELLGRAADVLRSFGSAFGGRHLAIVGGTVPSLLVDRVPEGIDPHVGTADLDLHLSLHLLDGETADYYEAIIDGLHNLKLEPGKKDGRELRWQWVGTHRGAHLQVELLCPVRSWGGRPEKPAENTTAERNIGPRGEIAALAVGFGHLVPVDTILVDREVETERGRLVYPFPVSNVTSWLCLKADAITLRDKPKDAYDVVWLIAGLGPEEVARRIETSELLRGPHREEVLAQLQRLLDQFKDVNRVGPGSYAEFKEGRSGEALFARGAVGELRRQLVARSLIASDQ